MRTMYSRPTYKVPVGKKPRQQSMCTTSLWLPPMGRIVTASAVMLFTAARESRSLSCPARARDI